MAANPMGKTRDALNPYLIYKNNYGWEWRVLKAYSQNPNKRYARWFCAVRSPMTFGGADLGDTYISDVVLAGGDPRFAGTLTYRDPVVPDSAIPNPELVELPDLF